MNKSKNKKKNRVFQTELKRDLRILAKRLAEIKAMKHQKREF